MTKMPTLTLILATLWTCAAPVHAGGRDGSPLRHDLFSRPTLVSPPAPGAAGQTAPVLPTEEAPASWRPQLRALVVAGPGSMVMLDRAVVVLGEEVEGHRLESVAEDRAVFVKGRKRVTLHLDRSRSVE